MRRLINFIIYILMLPVNLLVFNIVFIISSIKESIKQL